MLDSGLYFYSKSLQQKMDSNLFGGFFTALNSVAQAMGIDAISSLVINHTLYTFSKAYNLLFVLRTDTEANKEQIKRLLEKIKLIFFKHFPPEQYWVSGLTPRVAGMPLETENLVGTIRYNADKHQKLDAEYEELIADPVAKMKAILW